jgi:hypothetical protein
VTGWTRHRWARPARGLPSPARLVRRRVTTRPVVVDAVVACCQYAEGHSSTKIARNAHMTDSAPPPVPAQQPAAAPAPAPAEKWNVLSIIAFIIVFFGFSLVSINLGFIGLNQTKKTGERGRGLALWAIILGFVSIVIGIIFWIVFVAVIAANPNVTVN